MANDNLVLNVIENSIVWFWAKEAYENAVNSTILNPIDFFVKPIRSYR